MPDATLVPLLAPLVEPRRPDTPPRSPEAEQALGPKIVPAFRFVPEVSPLIADQGRLARDYARAAREAEGSHGSPQDPDPGGDEAPHRREDPV